MEYRPGIAVKRGVYEGDDITVIVSGESNAECMIRIEYVHGLGERSVYYYSGPLSEEMNFEGNDGNSDNAYHIVFDAESIHLTMKQLHITNEVGDWEFSDVDEVLYFSTNVIPNYDISSWSNEMIVQAINSYLQSMGEWSGYYVRSSDIDEKEKRLH